MGLPRDTVARGNLWHLRTYHNNPYIFDHVYEPVSVSLLNVLNHHALMYLVRSIASNQAYSQLLSRSVILGLKHFYIILYYKIYSTI